MDQRGVAAVAADQEIREALFGWMEFGADDYLSKPFTVPQLLAAVNARDDRALHALRITQEEFAVILWPEFPESRPITNITADDAWGMSIAQSVAGGGRAIGEYGGKDFVFLRVESAAPFPYRNFVLYRDVAIVVRDRASGVESRLTFAPSFVERKGRVKALIFRD